MNWLSVLLQAYIRDSELGKYLKGKKTYLVGGLMILQGLYGLLVGEVATFDNPSPMTQDQAINLILEGLGFGTVRAGIAKAGPQRIG